MGTHREFLTQKQFDEINVSALWQKIELDLPALRATPGIQRKHDLLGAYASGDANAPKPLNRQNAIAGIDVIVYERKPFIKRGEGDINVYHYVVTKTGRPDLPYCLHGPFTEETLMGHWPSCLDLSPYENP